LEDQAGHFKVNTFLNTLFQTEMKQNVEFFTNISVVVPITAVRKKVDQRGGRRIDVDNWTWKLED